MSTLTQTSHLVTGNTPGTEPENRAYFPALDGLRALAFLLVFAQHYLHMPWGWTGVDLFFVLSGFLITGILFDTRYKPHRIRNFYVRRTLRIFPLYYGLFAILLLTTPFVGWRWSPPWLAWPLYVGNYLRFLHPYVLGSPWQRVADAQLVGSGAILYMGHLWSLCVEEQFYLLWPWVVFFVRSRRVLLWICGTAVVVGPLLRIFAQHTASQDMLGAELLYRATPFRIDALLLGGLLALWYRGAEREWLLRVAHLLFWICTAIAAVYLGLANSLHWTFDVPWRLTWGLSFIDLYAGVMLLVAVQPGSVVYRVFHPAPLRWLGRMTYGAYIFHDIYHGVLFDWLRPHTNPHRPEQLLYLGSAAAFAVSVLLAWLSYRFFETPFLSLKERWTVR